MVSTLARILDIQFKRIQFTPDLMPSDITGTNVLEEDERGKRNFRFVDGPIFTNILLADEINRTPPKTQAALLQAMQEREVTVGQQTYPLPEPFSRSPRRTRSSRRAPTPCPKLNWIGSCSTSRSITLPPTRKSRFWPRQRGQKVEIRKVAFRQIDLEPAKAGRLGCRQPVHREIRLALVRATRPKKTPRPRIHPRPGRLGAVHALGSS